MSDLQTTLFNGNGEPSVYATANPRQAIVDATLDKADSDWKARYRAFVLDYADKADDEFTAEDVRLAYLATPGLPHTDREQASGKLFQRLVKEGLLVPGGMKRRSFTGTNCRRIEEKGKC